MRYVLIPSHTAGPYPWQILDKLDAYTVVWRGRTPNLPKALEQYPADQLPQHPRRDG